mmetsp:Transcript_9413/g.18305  ORF Transcript_9413/g.18305 Transcript_9413/m.18305 type:complete len:241 (-) Transcript_9413:319-1041(-)
MKDKQLPSDCRETQHAAVHQQRRRRQDPCCGGSQRVICSLDEEGEGHGPEVHAEHHLPLCRFVLFREEALPNVGEPIEENEQNQERQSHRPVERSLAPLGRLRVDVEEGARSDHDDHGHGVLKQREAFAQHHVGHEEDGKGLAGFCDLEHRERQELEGCKLAEGRQNVGDGAEGKLVQRRACSKLILAQTHADGNHTSHEPRSKNEEVRLTKRLSVVVRGHDFLLLDAVDEEGDDEAQCT